MNLNKLMKKHSTNIILFILGIVLGYYLVPKLQTFIIGGQHGLTCSDLVNTDIFECHPGTTLVDNFESIHPGLTMEDALDTCCTQFQCTPDLEPCCFDNPDSNNDFSCREHTTLNSYNRSQGTDPQSNCCTPPYEAPFCSGNTDTPDYVCGKGYKLKSDSHWIPQGGTSLTRCCERS